MAFWFRYLDSKLDTNVNLRFGKIGITIDGRGGYIDGLYFKESVAFNLGIIPLTQVSRKSSKSAVFCGRESTLVIQ